MGSFLEEIKRLFDTDNLYTLLGCEKSSSPAEGKFLLWLTLPVKRAFYKCSLKYHPDRNGDKDKTLATAQFQAISRAFSILSDKDAKDAYDETGIIGESFSEKSFKDWVDYFNLIFPRFTEKDIEKQKRKYIGSEEEKNDIAKYYERYQGDMDKIMESVIFADAFDEDRYRGIIQSLIDNGAVKPYDAFVKESAKKRVRRLNRAKREAAEFERQAKKQKTSEARENSMDPLVLAIQANKERRMKAADKLIDDITAKYCQPPNKKARKSSRGKK